MNKYLEKIASWEQEYNEAGFNKEAGFFDAAKKLLTKAPTPPKPPKTPTITKQPSKVVSKGNVESKKVVLPSREKMDAFRKANKGKFESTKAMYTIQ